VRCKVDLTNAAFRSTGTVVSVFSGRVLTVSGLENNANDFYALGKLTFTAGLNNGLAFEVKTHDVGTVTTLELWTETPFSVAASDTFLVTAGCAKDGETCRVKFSNLINFQGFEFIPGNDFVSRFPSRGGADQDGNSIFNK